MNKKLIALAVAGATFAPAVLAQSANPVTLYGRAWVMANSIKADGTATPLTSRNTIVNESSLIGVRGTEDLGGGLKAFFQMEFGFAPEENVTTVAALNPTPVTTPIGINNSPVSGRNSGVALIGDSGTILLGRWDSPLKLSQIIADPYGQNTIGNQLSIIGTGGFNRRTNNVVQYWSPTMSGFAVRLAYGANEGKSNARVAVPFNATTGAAAVPAANATNPNDLGGSIQYSNGPVTLNYGYEKHKDQRGNAFVANVVEKANNLSAVLVFGPIKLGLETQKISSTGLTDRKANTAGVTYTVGKNEFIATVGRLKNGLAASAAIQPETKQQGVGYNYNFSKRTTFMARYAQLKNNTASALDFQVGSSGLPTFAAGNDPKGFGVGLRHTF